MPETKEDIAAERDRLQAENENLRGQLAAASVPARGPAAPQHTFILTEDARQQLVTSGVAYTGGRVMTRDQVVSLLGARADAYDLGDVEPAEPVQPEAAPRVGIRGFDYVYPSIAPGVIDPAVAGTPGINGPSADDMPAVEKLA
jgi:hypothetical protein